MLTCWGGKDDYQFKFEPETVAVQQNGMIDTNYYAMNGQQIITTDENDNTMVIIPGKKVRVHNI